MAGEFWRSWEWWARLCFVLVCLVLVTVTIGRTVAFCKKRSLRKKESMEAAQRIHDNDIRLENIVPQARVNEIPFGIRAIESGIKVDGVWLSRPTTPTQEASTAVVAAASPATVPSSSRDTRQQDKRPSASEAPQLPLPLVGESHAGRLSTTPNKPAGKLSRPDVVGESGPSVQKSTSTGATGEHGHSGSQQGDISGQSMDGPSQDKITSVGESEGGQQQLDKAANTLEDVFTDGPYPSRSYGGASRSSSGRIQPPTLPPKAYLTKTPAKIRPTSSSKVSFDDVSISPKDERQYTEWIGASNGNLESLNSHRLSHAAEIGQLVPRTRRGGVVSDDFSTMRSSVSRSIDNRAMIAAQRPSSMDMSTRVSPYPTRAMERQRFSFETQDPYYAQESGTATQDFITTSHPSSHEASQDSSPPIPEKSPRRRTSSYGQGEPSVRRNAQPLNDEALDGEASSDKMNTSYRRVNSGFEVFPAGALDRKGKAADRSRDSADVDLEAGPVEVSRTTRKLHKKNRLSSSSYFF